MVLGFGAFDGNSAGFLSSRCLEDDPPLFCCLLKDARRDGKFAVT